MNIRQYFTYLLRRTAIGVLGLFFVIWMLVISVDLIEAMREVGKVEGAGFGQAIQMTLLRTPQLMLTVLPFVFLFGTLWAFGQMAKTSEISVMRAAGLSVWRLVAAPLLLALIVGFTTVLALDPIAAHLAGRAQTIKNEMRGKDANMVAEFRKGVWLKQVNQNNSTIIHAATYNPGDQILSGVIVWKHAADGVFIERWDADSAIVSANSFTLRMARRSTLHGENEDELKEKSFPVSIDLRTLREDVAKPEALSVWQIPEFSRVMSSAGMSTKKYDIRFHDLWSLPVKLAAMALIGCGFALGMNARAGGTAYLMGIGIATGFVLFILAELSSNAAMANTIPVGLATWAPGIFAILFAAGVLVYREDG